MTNKSGHTDQELTMPHLSPSYTGLASFIILVSHQCFYTLLVTISPYSTGYDTDNTSSRITVSHHSKDVIVISLNLHKPDPDLSDHLVYPVHTGTGFTTK